MLLRRLRWIIGLKKDDDDDNNNKSPVVSTPKALSFPQHRRLLIGDANHNHNRISDSSNHLAMLESVQEIAIYIHRFHNLDLFQQGWYQIKITMRREDDTEVVSPGTPARVVQYEAPDDIHGVWRIDDTDNSFSTQPFRIKYARQDILLSVMISFNLSVDKYKGTSTSAVILKFELLYASHLENGSGLYTSLDTSPTATHEFRIPPKALLGLHSYCPVHFDAFHSVLVDSTVHITLLKAGFRTSRPKVSSEVCAVDTVAGNNVECSHQESDTVTNAHSQQLVLVKELWTARDRLNEELRRLSKSIEEPIDLTDYTTKFDGSNFLHPLQRDSNAYAAVLQEDGPQNSAEKAIGVDAQRQELLEALPAEDLINYFHSLGDQVLYLWNTFLKFHRANNLKILDFLYGAWAGDRKAEWSIWMVYSKVDMPHHYISSGVDDLPNHGSRGKAPVIRKFTDDPVQTASARAELHRRSIAQMRINNRSIQDMHIFGDPSRIPIIFVERVVNSPLRTTSGNSYFCNLDYKDKPSLVIRTGLKDVNKSLGSSMQKGRALSIAVFVHGFQGHHLDLRLVRNQWLLIDPKVEFLMSEANEEKTSGDFREMGLRLAQEMISFVKKKMDKITARFGSLKSIKLSFVGHSIGNIIIRAALAEGIMEPYLRYLHTYVSVSGPHLGYLYSSNSLFNSGLWLLKKFKNTQCIHQLTMTDDPDLQNTFFYNLCKHKTLDNFKNIILFSSPQDGYVPYHSARIELCPASTSDYSKRGKVFLEMLNNCLDQIRAPSCEHRVFMRCDVNFDTSAHGLLCGLSKICFDEGKLKKIMSELLLPVELQLTPSSGMCKMLKQEAIPTEIHATTASSCFQLRHILPPVPPSTAVCDDVQEEQQEEGKLDFRITSNTHQCDSGSTKTSNV